MTATSLDLSQIKTDALSAASTFRTLIGLGSGDTPTFKGATLSAGTITASTPAVDISQTWNNAGVTFTGILANVTDTSSNASSLLMDLQVGGSSKFSVSKTGSLAIPISQIIKFGSTNPASIFQGFNDSLYIGGSTTATTWAAFDANGIYIRSNAAFRWSTSATDPYATQLALFADAADTLAQRRTTNAQTFRIYNTTDSGIANYERAKLEWSSNVFRIGTEKAGSGSARALELQTDGTTRLTIGTTGAFSLTGTSTTTLSVPVSGQVVIDSDSATGSTPLTIKYAGTTKFSFSYTGSVTIGASSNEGVINLNGGYGYVTTVGSSATTRHLQLRSYNGIDLDIGGLGGSGLKLLTFGGSTSSFPAIKRNGTAVNFRLADDSADCDITAAALTLSGDLTISTKNIVTDTTTGTKIGTATNQKIGFFNATPVVQPTAVADATDAASVITQLNALLSRMRDLGLIAT